MTKRKTMRGLIVVVFALLFLVIAVFCFMLATSRGSKEGISYLDVTSALVGEQELEQMKEQSQYLILVNKIHGLDKNYQPDDLCGVQSYADDRNPKYQMLRAEAANAFNQLSVAAGKDNYIIKLTTGYRSYAYQQQLHDSYISRNGGTWTEQYSAEPGYSEHQTGLAADVSAPSVNYKLVTKFGETAEGKWLAENAHRFGFIIRYPEGKEDITGYEYEPWHIRYVGVDIATQIYNNNLTLEEYLGDI